MPSHSESLRQKMALLRPRMRQAAARFWDHQDIRLMFPDFLMTTHEIVRAAVPLMEAARDESRRRADNDPAAAALAGYFDHHIEEERRHDEWLLDDIEALGISRDEVWARIPSPAVAALAGRQYYWLRHSHPVALMGYIGVLEIPASPAFLERVVKRTGLPPNAFRTWLEHARLDADHIADFNAALDRLPLRPDHAALLGVSVFATMDGVAQCYDDVVDDFEQGRSARRASALR
jgi:hypothetical protein